jgi:hypothetical protein
LKKRRAEQHLAEQRIQRINTGTQQGMLEPQ